MIISLTGHRPDHLGGRHDPHELTPAIEVVKKYLVELANGEPCEVVSGFAEGFDLVGAWAALMLAKEGRPFTLTAALPWPGFTDRIRNARAAKWAAAALERAEAAGHVHLIAKEKPPKVTDPRSGNLVEDTRRINGLLYQRNVWMVNRLNLKQEPGNQLLACWDGDIAARSGTKNTIHYAVATFRHAPINCWNDVAEALRLAHRLPNAPFDYTLLLRGRGD